MNLNYIIQNKIKNRRNAKLIKDFIGLFGKYFLTRFPKNIQNFLNKFPFLFKNLGIKYLWIFYECDLSFFLNFYKVPKGPFFSFEILQFSLKKEMRLFKQKIRKSDAPVLILNNFSSEKSELILFEQFLKEIFGSKNKEKIKIEKVINILLVDFLKFDKKFEFRNYCLTKTNLLIPRKLRRDRSFPKKNLIYPELLKVNEKNFFDSKIGSWFKKKKKEKFSSIDIIEIGPRLTLKELEITKIIK